MLGKVMKYELRACGRMLLPFFGVAVVFSAAMRGLLELAPRVWQPAAEAVTGLAAVMGVLAITAVVLLTFVYLFVRFYQGMVAGEATLTFTLPVSAGTHLAARTLVGVIYSVASYVVAAAALLILVPGLLQFFAAGSLPVSSSFAGNFEVPLASIPAHLKWSFGGWWAVCMLLGSVSNLLYMYCAMAIGTLITQKRILGTVVAYLVMQVVESFISLLLMLPFFLNLGRTTEEFTARMFGLSGDPVEMLAGMMDFMWYTMLTVLLSVVILTVAHYLITRYIFTKKLNLE